MEPEETGRQGGPEHAATGPHREDDAQEEPHCSERMIEEALHPRNRGMMLDPDGHAALSASCGDTIEIFLRLNEHKIAMAAFMTNGCMPTVACGSMLTAMVQGMSFEQATSVDAADLIVALDGLPAEHVHCATLAVSTLREAINQGTAVRARREDEWADDAADSSAPEDSAGEIGNVRSGS